MKRLMARLTQLDERLGLLPPVVCPTCGEHGGHKPNCGVARAWRLKSLVAFMVLGVVALTFTLLGDDEPDRGLDAAFIAAGLVAAILVAVHQRRRG
jgi:hypothetical protein